MTLSGLLSDQDQLSEIFCSNFGLSLKIRRRKKERWKERYRKLALIISHVLKTSEEFI
jgi:hypothetical protein